LHHQRPPGLFKDAIMSTKTGSRADNAPPVVLTLAQADADADFEEIDSHAALVLDTLWKRHPEKAFRWLRDHLCEVVDIVAKVFRKASRASSAKTTLAEIGNGLYAPLGERLLKARGIWVGTQAKAHLEVESPVYLDPEYRKGVIRGTCCHDLTLSLANSMYFYAGEHRAREYVRRVNEHVSEGARVGDLLQNLDVGIRLECNHGIKCWRETEDLAGQGADQILNLDQAACFAGCTKKTLERYLHDPKYADRRMPPPDIEGGGGRPHKWYWSTLRPWLIRVFKRDKLPERLPIRSPIR
jgi:hypothetical protein